MSEVPSSDPTPSAAQVRLLEVTVTGTTVEPAPDQVDLAVGETLRLVVTSDGGSAIHTHGLGDIEAPLTPGEPTTVDLVGDVRVSTRSSCTTPTCCCRSPSAERLPVVRLAHGIGSRADLPLPFLTAVVGAAVVLVVTFALLGLLWRAPRPGGGDAGRPLPATVARFLDSRWLRGALAVVGAVFAIWTLTALVLGPQNARNATPFTRLRAALGKSVWSRCPSCSGRPPGGG